VNARVQRLVVHAGSDPRAAQRLADRLPAALHARLEGAPGGGRRDVEQLVRRAAREARP
jgi:plasmid stabilization system protein ParE